MAVGSYVVIPLFEELFYRGYAQYRLEKEFKFFAVLLIPLLFTSTHFQYFISDIFNIGMLFSLLILAIGMAFSRYLSKSIIASIIIHSLMNIPMKYPYDLLALSVMIFIVVLLRKRIVNLVTILINELKRIDFKGNFMFFLIILAFALGMNFKPEITLVIFVLLFIISLTMQLLNNRKFKIKVTKNV